MAAASPGTFSIKVVARMTGLSPDVIRAWERRYGAIAPARAERGIRLYRPQDVERLIRLKDAVAQGHAIGRIATLSDADLAALTVRTEAEPSEGPPPMAQRVLAAVERLDAMAADEALGEAAVLLSPDTLLSEVVQPLLIHVGTTWSRQPLGIAREHLATGLLRSLLGTLLRTRQVDRRQPPVLLGTLPGELHELGLLMVALRVASQGIPVCYLGPNLPPAEIVGAARVTGARTVGLSLAFSPDDTQREAIARIARDLPPEVDLWLGGCGAGAIPPDELPPRATVFSSLDEVDRRLGLQR